MSAPNRILELVDRFERNADEYRAPQYGEAVTRIEFINPLFECLGWDIDNRRGAAEKYKDVIHEAAIKIGGATQGTRKSTHLYSPKQERDRHRNLLAG